MGKKSRIGERLVELLGSYNGNGFGYGSELPNIETFYIPEKQNGRQKKDLLYPILEHLISKNYTQAKIAKIVKCSPARISQILKEGREDNKSKEQNNGSEE
jgi:hypothetical protein